MANYNKHKAKDHQKILKRKFIIEQRKEQMETQHYERVSLQDFVVWVFLRFAVERIDIMSSTATAS